MTNIEMQYEFSKLIQEMDESFESIKRPSSETIFRMLNYAINRYIKEKYLSGPTMAQNIQQVQYRADDLRNLIVSFTTAYPVTPLSPYTHFIKATLPENYMFYIRSDSKILRSAIPVMTNYEWTPNRVANYDEIDKIVTSPTNKPILRMPVVVFEGQNIMSIHFDRYTVISDVSITYLRVPKLLVLDLYDVTKETTECELAIHTHEEIVKLAVAMYIDEYKFHLNRGS
jgi:hypothetical protein